MGWLDIGILAVLAGSLFFGYRRGFVQQLVELTGLVAGVMLALYLTGALVTNYAKPLADYRVTYPVVFLLIVAVSLLVAQVVGRVAGEVAQITLFGPFDQLGGAIAGLGKGVLWLGITVSIVHHLDIGTRVDTELRKSSFAGPLSQIVPAAFDVLKTHAKDTKLSEPFRTGGQDGDRRVAERQKAARAKKQSSAD